jgi:hypothetical protein
MNWLTFNFYISFIKYGIIYKDICKLDPIIPCNFKDYDEEIIKEPDTN